MPAAPVLITGLGVITAIGANVDSCLDALQNDCSGIALPRFLKTHWQEEIPVGEVRLSNNELAEQLRLPASWPRTALLSAAAFAEAWQPFESIDPSLRKGFFSANTVGGMDRTEAAYPEFKAPGPQAIAPFNYRHHECGAVTELVARHFGFDDFNTTISTACSSSANAIMMAAQMINAGALDVAVAGGADALCRFTLNGFNTLMILDREPCRPFDQNRRGLNLGEGAGYVVLMSEKAANALKTAPLAALSGWANANDAYHQTASSPEGIGNELAIRGALEVAGLQPEAISYINLHGTGTPNNDSSEGKAIERVFGQNVPPASSTKAFTGHTLGAAGGVEAVFSVLALRHGLIFPNLRRETQMEDVGFAPAMALKEAPLRHVLSNSFGFGGNCSSLIFSAA